MQQFTNLRVWQLGHELALRVYKATESFPPRERYSLSSQLRRAALSIPTNIAEGAKRLTQRDFAHFLNIAETSATEVEYLAFFSGEVGLLSPTECAWIMETARSLQRQICALRKRVR